MSNPTHRNRIIVYGALVVVSVLAIVVSPTIFPDSPGLAQALIVAVAVAVVFAVQNKKNDRGR